MSLQLESWQIWLSSWESFKKSHEKGDGKGGQTIVFKCAKC